MSSRKALLWEERKRFHQELLRKILFCDSKGIVSNADSHQKTSIKNAKRIFDLIGGGGKPRNRLKAQELGDLFEICVADFLQATFTQLSHLRPGDWDIYQVKSRGSNKIADFAQYAHLDELQRMLKAQKNLAAYLGNDYMVAPDVVVLRKPETDAKINAKKTLVDRDVAQSSDLRKACNPLPLLHASVSCKWTIRSDRAQNARAEALNLIRNRKGQQPHIVVVTAEPAASRLASLALGTGDIDCMYHFALYELKQAIEESGNDEAKDLLNTMIDGKRLKDISDLPMDLAV